MFAIVVISGKQYSVSPGDTIEVDRMEGKDGDVLTFDQVLLVHNDKKVSVGTPQVKGATIKAKILAQTKGDKVHVRRFKSKVRYRKATGFRSQRTKLEIVSIS